MRALWNRFKQVSNGFPDIAEQLGCPLSDDPGSDHKALYVQLLVGFELIAKGNTYPGYSMVYNEGLGQVEVDLINGNAERVIESHKCSHHFWRTAVMEATSAARQRHAVLKSRIEWIGRVDPILSMALAQIGLRSYSVGCTAMALHWQAEQEVGRALEAFPHEYFEALRGNSLEDTAQRSGETGT